MDFLKCDRCGEKRPPSHGLMHACDDGGFGELAPETDCLEYEKLMAESATVVATGNTYEHRAFLKRIGFLWDATEKHWFQKVEDDEIDELCEKLKEACPGVRATIQTE